MSEKESPVLATYKPIDQHLDKLNQIVDLIASTVRKHNKTNGVDIPLDSIGIPCTLFLYESFGHCYIFGEDGKVQGVNVPSLVVQRIGTEEGFENRGLCSIVVAALEKIVSERIPLLDVHGSAVKRIASACKIQLDEFTGPDGYCRQLHIESILTSEVRDMFFAKGYRSFLEYGYREQMYKVYPVEGTVIGSILSKVAFDQK